MKYLALLLIVITSLACSTLSLPVAATSTPTPRPTLMSTSTAEIIPTVESTSPPDVSAFPDMPNDLEVLIPHYGFSLQVPFNLKVDVQKFGLFISEDKNNYFIAFAGSDSPTTESEEESLNRYLAAFEKKNGKLNTSDQSAIVIDGHDAIQLKISGDINGVPVSGTGVAVSPRSGYTFIGMGLSREDSDGKKWAAFGAPVFDKLLSTVYLFDPSAACDVSSDKTYGYSQDNPILVGGGDFSGPSRENAYLDNLLGPNGESLSYERRGSLEGNSTILDEYLITGDGINAVLYIDEYNYQGPIAPVGFSCFGPFPFDEP